MAGKKVKEQGCKNGKTSQAISTTAEDPAEFTAQELADGELLLQAIIAAESDNEKPESGGSEDKDIVYDMPYILAHMDQKFHHIGDGRYKRGPKPRQDGEGRKDKEAGTAGGSRG
ncbi:hypothetical protein LTR78_006779 [Recurvomyces mirabilis]|uniref:Uncharacterized protein n=1 Tax=Recurvomyces mirabilis TaxID=574656 RepID=A0AAE0WK70_9PEZI|nr:hypothetical protein LTR78_006779 [Recurvomyces mirabilis]KAK5153231.1 hypothetical protein LTS14_007876 [Recurvomyces mirabilis]